jgi:hypothetical protein
MLSSFLTQATKHLLKSQKLLFHLYNSVEYKESYEARCISVFVIPINPHKDEVEFKDMYNTTNVSRSQGNRIKTLSLGNMNQYLGDPMVLRQGDKEDSQPHPRDPGTLQTYLTWNRNADTPYSLREMSGEVSSINKFL